MSDQKKRVYNSDPFLSVQDAAEYCGLGVDLIYEAVWRNELVCHRFGKRSIRIRLSALNEFINSRESAPKRIRRVV